MKFEDILSFVDEDLDTIYRRLDNIETLYDIYPITPHERQLVLQGFEVIHEKLKRIEKCKSNHFLYCVLFFAISLNSLCVFWFGHSRAT